MERTTNVYFKRIAVTLLVSFVVDPCLSNSQKIIVSIKNSMKVNFMETLKLTTLYKTAVCKLFRKKTKMRKIPFLSLQETRHQNEGYNFRACCRACCGRSPCCSPRSQGSQHTTTTTLTSIMDITQVSNVDLK